MAVFTNYDTQRLTRTRLELVPGRGRRAGWPMAILISVLVIATALAMRQAPGTFDIVSLLKSRQESTRLQSELQRTRVELDVERATRAELERQIQTLGEQVTKLNQQAEFMSSRANGQTAALPSVRTTAGNPQE